MYIQMISLHGLVRGENIEMGRDADTGGQVRYVIELAKTLGTFDDVKQVDLFTRRIRDKKVASDYGEMIEELGPKVRIIRLPCGGGRYIRKELLWPYVDEFVDRMISFTRQEGHRPSIVHGHYADAGYIAKEVAAALDVPFAFTGHSMGKSKLDYLLSEGWELKDAIRQFRIDHRIEVEQACIAEADIIVTSTRHERDEQYGLYEVDEDTKFSILPPGVDLERFFPYYEYSLPNAQVGEHYKQARIRMEQELARFHFQNEKPLILALCRPDKRKNIGALIKAYGESKELQAMANLAVFAGIRTRIEEMEEAEQAVLTDILLMMDRYDLYGKLAIPKNHDSESDVPELYRLAASRRGVFVNTAFVEPFGLTFIESSATGLPFVGTQNGGPQDIVANCNSGVLVDVTNNEELIQSLLSLLTDQERWESCSSNGVNKVREHYTWHTHCQNYLKAIKPVVHEPTKTPSAVGRYSPGPRLASVGSLLITDIDNTLLGDDDLLKELQEILRAHRDRIGFGVASGRSLELITDVLQKNGIENIDVAIASVGSEIYYGNDFVPDKGWASHLRPKWRPERIHRALDEFPFIHLQKEEYSQREFKISYDLDDSIDPEEALHRINEALTKARAAYKLIFSHGSFIDILPPRASKGKAIRHLSTKWNIPLERIATSGDSGNDYDMLTGQTAGIVVGNYDPELESLKEIKSGRVFFAKALHAGGIIEGLKHYGLIE